MPIGPWLVPLISGLFDFAGGALAGQDGPQERHSFAGTSASPTQNLGEFFKNVNGFGAAAADKLSKGTQLRGVAPTPPGFKVQDPAVIDPNLLKYDGLDLSGLGQLFQKPAPHAPGQPQLDIDERRERRQGRENRGIR